ncbi:MAG TPA: hypothetical protein VF035_09180 [Longimicrobiales bacterium]
MLMRARRSVLPLRARVHHHFRTRGIAAALLVLLAVPFVFAPRPSAAADIEAPAAGVHALELRQENTTATPFRPDVTAASLFSRIQHPLRRAWDSRLDAGFELILPAHAAWHERLSVSTARYLLHSSDLLRRKTGSVSSHTTSLPPPAIV